MAASLVGSAGTASAASTTTSLAASFGQAPTAGNLLIMALLIWRPNDNTPTIPTPSGWTAGPAGGNTVAGSNWAWIATFYRAATGGDSPPTLTFTTSSKTGILVEEWSGLQSPPFDAASAVGNQKTTTAAVDLTPPAVTTSYAEDLIWTFMGAWASDSGRVLTWGGGSSAVTTVVKDADKWLVSGKQVTTAAGTFTPSLQVDSGNFNWNGSCSVNLAFKITSLPPNSPILNSPATGQSLDVDADNDFTWTPSNGDGSSTQSKADLRYRLLGAPAWTTVTVVSPVTKWTAPAGTFVVGDYEWQARTYDPQGQVGPYSPSGFFSTVSAPAAPTITAPASGATVGSSENVTWSTPTQARYQVRRVADNAGTVDPSTVYWDTGEIVDDVARSATVAFPTNNRWEWVQVRVKDGGLWSQWASVRVQVSWTPPADPTAVKASVPADAAIDLTITNPAPTGGEPTVAYNDIYFAEPGEAEERKATLVPPNSTWRHWLPASDAVYTYRVVAVATNQTTSEVTVS